MKNIISPNNLFFLIFLISLTKCINEKKQLNSNLIRIEITYVDFSTLTFSRVSCNNFEKTFEKVSKKKVITNKKEINKILSYIEDVIKQNKIVSNLDVRFKMRLIYKNGEEKIICGNGNTIKFGNKKYFITKNFSLLLSKLIESE